jgi:hypothetical protein
VLAPEFFVLVTAAHFDELFVLLLRAQARARAAGLLPAVSRRALARVCSPSSSEVL